MREGNLGGKVKVYIGTSQISSCLLPFLVGGGLMPAVTGRRVACATRGGEGSMTCE